jgi:hypothetical protein
MSFGERDRIDIRLWWGPFFGMMHRMEGGTPSTADGPRHI